MTNDDMMTEGGGKMTKLSMLIFQSPSIKPSLEICLVIPKEGIVILMGTGCPQLQGGSKYGEQPNILCFAAK